MRNKRKNIKYWKGKRGKENNKMLKINVEDSDNV